MLKDRGTPITPGELGCMFFLSAPIFGLLGYLSLPSESFWSMLYAMMLLAVPAFVVVLFQSAKNAPKRFRVYSLNSYGLTKTLPIEVDLENFEKREEAIAFAKRKASKPSLNPKETEIIRVLDRFTDQTIFEKKREPQKNKK